MQRLTLSICAGCRRSLSPWFNNTGQLYTCRFYSGAAALGAFAQTRHGNPGLREPASAHGSTVRDISDPCAYFKSNVAHWANMPRVRQRLDKFGIPDSHITPLLGAFVEEARSGRLSTDDGFAKYHLSRFSDTFPSGRAGEFTDRIFTNIFYAWASDPAMQFSLAERTSLGTILAIQRLYAAADLSYPAEAFYFARTLRRKVIMHVGPTNSGKTHNALRALAGAKIGLYAGPLRLLAHEIWERLNLGQIVPQGVDPEPDTPDVGLNMDIADESKTAAPTVRQHGNPKYARLCNLLTGEEHKIVDDAATLLSCTVEMVSSTAEYDVAVIDEVQMLADPERGGAWTNAFLGLCAKEIHLCGEETAVPLIKELIKDTGDVLTVHRYQRLTPLVVEQDSLEGDLSRVRKGDCIVTFSRASIFGLKRRVEEITGLRCAVAYGRLPPEIRSEQAAMFNDPNSGYDVMIGSDAIGMGLNLKIKRVIFEAVRKFDGRVERPLSSSQVKQIAGRAGRYGLHGNSSPTGLVTTLHIPDLPVLREALAAPITPLQYAYLSSTTENIATVAQALPPAATTSTIYEVNIFVSRVRAIYRFVEYPRLAAMSHFIDTKGGELTLDDRSLLMMAPIPWQDDVCLEVVARFLRMYQSTMRVVFLRGIEGLQFIENMVQVEDMMARGVPPISSPNTLGVLETFHKVLVLYMWLSFRNPVAFGDHVEVAELKGRVEKVLDWCLEGVSGERERERSRRGSGAQRPRSKILWTSRREMKARREDMRRGSYGISP